MEEKGLEIVYGRPPADVERIELEELADE